MTQISVDALNIGLLDVFDTFRGQLPLPDYRDTIIAAIALKAAEEREPYKNTLSARDLLPGAGSSQTLTPYQPASPAWSDLASLAPEELIEALQRRRRKVEEREPSLAGALMGLDTGRAATEGKALKLLVRALVPISFDPATFEAPWILGAALDRFILQLAHANRSRGEYSTGRGVSRLLVGLADLGPGLSVHDPAAGSCRLLVECARQVAELGNDPSSLRLSGTENNGSSWALGRIYLWACGLDATAVKLGDGLATPDGLFDRVVCDPPFGRIAARSGSIVNLGLDGGMRLLHLEDAFLYRSRQLLAPEGCAVVLVPQGSLFRAQAAAVRRNFVEERLLRCVVQLPAGLLFGTSITTAALVISRKQQNGIVFADARGAEWDVKTGDLATSDVKALRAIVAGGTARLPARNVPYQDIVASDFVLTPDRFLRSEREADVVLVSQGDDNRQLGSEEVFLTEEQQRALEEIKSALADGAILNLVGHRGTGKTALLRILRERLTDATVIAIGLGSLERGALVNRLRQELSSWQGREGRLVLLLDDWDCAANVVDEQELADLQRLLYIVVTRGPGSGVVFVSQRPLAELQADWSREILARSALGATKTVTLGSPAPRDRELLEKRMRVIWNRLARDPSTDFSAATAELRASPLWADLTNEFGDLQRSGHLEKWVSVYFDSGDWERFLRELAARETWLGNECRALGYDIERDRGGFGTFLVRANLSPEEFVGELLRPSDVRTLFPNLKEFHEKSAAVRAAFKQWKAREDRP
jgi:type I restriction-modification system DNA methylase subunit